MGSRQGAQQTGGPRTGQRGGEGGPESEEMEPRALQRNSFTLIFHFTLVYHETSEFFLYKLFLKLKPLIRGSC